MPVEDPAVLEVAWHFGNMTGVAGPQAPSGFFLVAVRAPGPVELGPVGHLSASEGGGPMRRTIDEAKDLSGRLALMQRDARDLVAELGRIIGALRTGGLPESSRGKDVAREICDRRDAELLEELARAMSTPGGETFLHRR